MRLTGSILALITSASVTQAALVVDFGGVDYVTANTNMLNATGGTTSNADLNADAKPDASRTIAFTSQLLNNAGTSGKVYGGYRIIELSNATTTPTSNASSPNVDDWNVENNAAGDRLNLRVQFATGITAGEYSGAFYWKKADFLNGADANGIASVQSLSASLLDKAAGARWLIEQGGQFYVSNATLSANTTNTLLNPSSATTWAPFNLGDANFNQSAATFSALAVANITAAGIYYEEDAQGTAARRLRITGFEVDATLVPEPASLASLALMGLACLRRRR